MEQVFGRPAFDDFLRRYFDRFAFRSITTADALAYIRRDLFDRFPERARQIPLDEWVFQPGLPASAPEADSTRLRSVAEAALRWLRSDEAGELPARNWSTQEWLEFLQTLPPALDVSRMAELDSAFRLTANTNYEVLKEWLLIAVTNRYEPAFPTLEPFLMEVGRIKLLKPLYTELMKTGDGASFAKAVYEKARPRYHPIARTAIDKLVHLSRQKLPANNASIPDE